MHCRSPRRCLFLPVRGQPPAAVPLGSPLKPRRTGRGTGQRGSPPARRPRRRTSNRSVVSEGRFVARHSLPRGHHVRYALPQSVTRHAVDEDAFAVVNSAPVRRGIAVVAVVGGALSAGTVSASPPQQPQPDTDAAIGLTAHSKKADKDDDEDEDEKADKKADRSDDDPVLDVDAVKKAVR